MKMFYARIALAALFGILTAIMAVQAVYGWFLFLIVAALTVPPLPEK